MQTLRTRCLYLVTGALAGLLLINLYFLFSRTGFILAHDEAEHLHVIFALQRGERPYLDFIENHPLFLHALLSQLLDSQAWGSTVSLYLSIKGVIALHCLGTFLLFAHGTRKLFHGSTPVQSVMLYLVGLASLGIWKFASGGDYHSIWQLRPDWISYFYATLAIHLHASALINRMHGKNPSALHWTGFVAGASAGLSIAILPKAIYLFAPYAATLAILLSTCPPRQPVAWIKEHGRWLLAHGLLCGLLALTIFGLCLLYELSICGIGLEPYYQANFAFNASKHIPLNTTDLSPFNLLRGLTGLGLLATLILGLFIYATLLSLHKRGKLHAYACLLFCSLCILLNALIPAYSNGLTWAHYFMVSLLALASIFASAFAQVWRLNASGKILVSQTPAGIIHKLQGALPLLLALYIGLNLIQQIAIAYELYEARIYSQTLYRTANGDTSMELLPDRYLPSDLTYLTFTPKMKPVRAKAWGYYFMLFPDASAFPTMEGLGLAPPLEVSWRQGFKQSPPDAILLNDRHDLEMRSVIAGLAGNPEFAWIWPQIEANYSCRSQRSVQLYVRNDLLHRFPLGEWKLCAPETSTKKLND